MEIKGNIGDNVYVKAQIRSVSITDKGTLYRVVTGVGYLDLTEEAIEFLENDEPKAEPKEEKKEPQEEPQEEQKVSKNTLKTQEGRFQHSRWLRETIEASKMSQKAFCDALNAWLAIQHNEGKHTNVKSYYASDLSNYMNGNTYMSEYKLHVIKEFAEGLEKETAVTRAEFRIHTWSIRFSVLPWFRTHNLRIHSPLR